MLHGFIVLRKVSLRTLVPCVPTATRCNSIRCTLLSAAVVPSFSFALHFDFDLHIVYESMLGVLKCFYAKVFISTSEATRAANEL